MFEEDLVWLVPAGPQDSSVGDSGHAGHRAQRVIEPSPVQSGIRQDGGALLGLCVLLWEGGADDGGVTDSFSCFRVSMMSV